MWLAFCPALHLGSAVSVVRKRMFSPRVTSFADTAVHLIFVPGRARKRESTNSGQHIMLDMSVPTLLAIYLQIFVVIPLTRETRRDVGAPNGGTELFAPAFESAHARHQVGFLGFCSRGLIERDWLH